MHEIDTQRLLEVLSAGMSYEVLLWDLNGSSLSASMLGVQSIQHMTIVYAWIVDPYARMDLGGGEGGAKRQYVIWWGRDIALSTCTALDNVTVPGSNCIGASIYSFIHRLESSITLTIHKA